MPAYTQHRSDQRTAHPEPRAFEHGAVQAVKTHPRASIAEIGRHFPRHLLDEFGLEPAHLTALPSSLYPSHPGLSALEPTQALRLSTARGIPTDRPIIAAVGRTDAHKGLDLLIDALASARERIHFAALCVHTGDERAGMFEGFKRQADAAGPLTTLVDHFDRDLPRILALLFLLKAVFAQWPGTLLELLRRCGWRRPGYMCDMDSSELQGTPNVVLRGGPADGETMYVTSTEAMVELSLGGQIHSYRPTPDLDDEYPNLTAFAFVGSITTA